MESFDCGNIRFNEDSIKELEGTQVMVSIPRADVVSIELRYGNSVEKPIMQTISGTVLCLLGFSIGVWPLVGYLSHANSQGSGYLAPIAFAVPLILLGIYTMAPVVRRCNYLLVTTASGSRKLSIKGCNPSDLLSTARSCGYLTGREKP
jgi:hypothetical protein